MDRRIAEVSWRPLKASAVSSHIWLLPKNENCCKSLTNSFCCDYSQVGTCWWTVCDHNNPKTWLLLQDVLWNIQSFSVSVLQVQGPDQAATFPSNHSVCRKSRPLELSSSPRNILIPIDLERLASDQCRNKVAFSTCDDSVLQCRMNGAGIETKGQVKVLILL